METGGIKSSGAIRTQDLGTARPQVRRVTANASSGGTASDGTEAWKRRVPETDNMVSANGYVYDRSAPRGTYLNILV